MARLFVDCDDTLVIWDDSSRKVNQDKEIWIREKWEIDRMVVGDIDCFLSMHPEYQLIVWSGGGVKYAAGWAEKCNFQHPVIILPKDMRTPEDQDICIDDMHGEIAPRDKRVRVLPPNGLRRCPLCTPDPTG